MAVHIIAFLFIALKGINGDHKTAYIEYYSPIAVAEMNRTGIPASIKLAQGMHESGAGTSKLSTSSNNHFGIKCKTHWLGETYFHKDDDYDKSGTLVESCFRAYKSPVDSYIDHSNFIINSIHYSRLIEICGKDYKQWAYGLQNMGYATDPKYADKLIKIIESHQLYRFD